MSPYLARKTTKLYPVETELIDMCRNGCRFFKQEDGLTECECCHQARYEGNMAEKIPVKQMRILPLSAQFATLLSNDHMRDLLSYRADFDHESGVYTDIFDGHAYQSLKSNGLFDGIYDIALALFVDGFQPFDGSRVSMTIVHAVIMNFPPSKRYAQLINIYSFTIGLLKRLDTKRII